MLSVVAEFAVNLMSYQVTTVRGDRNAGEWPREQFGKHGVAYEPADKTRSKPYIELSPMLNSAGASQLDDKRRICLLIDLERRTSQTG
jgi:hypothetical protein